MKLQLQSTIKKHPQTRFFTPTRWIHRFLIVGHRGKSLFMRLYSMSLTPVCEVYLGNMGLIEDHVSHIAIITSAGQITNQLFAGHTAAETNPMSIDTNNIPLIQFYEVPITLGIQSLAKQANINYMINPGVEDLWLHSSQPQPAISLRFQNVTARNALIRVLNLYNLVLIEDPTNHVAHIAFPGDPTPGRQE